MQFAESRKWHSCASITSKILQNAPFLKLVQLLKTPNKNIFSQERKVVRRRSKRCLHATVAEKLKWVFQSFLCYLSGSSWSLSRLFGKCCFCRNFINQKKMLLVLLVIRKKYRKEKKCCFNKSNKKLLSLDDDGPTNEGAPHFLLNKK